MIDPRWHQLADILINYSTKTQPGDKVLITMLEVDTFPLARAVHAAALKAGGLPHVEFQSVLLERDLMLYGSMEQIDWLPEMQAKGMEWADVYIGLRGAANPHEFTGIPAEKIMVHRRALGKISAMRTALTRWVLVRVPNVAFAQQAGMSHDAMMDFFFNATLRDWATETQAYTRYQQLFQSGETVHIVGRDTDLTLSTRGRSYCIDHAFMNMPGGEIFTAPVDDSAEGYITFDFPGVFAGQLVEGIRLEFSQGRVVKATATKNQALLHQLLEMDEGSDRIGEFAIGANWGIDHFCYDILYDEKIGGTVHIALGRAYTECGGINQSALHWDIVKDMRQEGEIYLDGRKVFEKGKFLGTE